MNKNFFRGVGVLAISLIALPVFAQTAPSTPRSTINNICVQAAVDVREQAIIDAWSAFTTSMNTALTARKAALHAAWGTNDGVARRAARSAAWGSFQDASRGAHSTLRNARNAAWTTFHTASRACGVPVVEARGLDTAGTIGM